MAGQERGRERKMEPTGAGRAPQPGPRQAWIGRYQSQPYEELDHPADLLLAIRGKDREELLSNALYALYDNIVELPGVQGERLVTIRAEGENTAQVLQRLLNEALFLLDTEGFVGTGAEVRLTGGESTDISAQAQLWGGTLDPTHHEVLGEIKAATQHGLEVCRARDEGLIATILLDT